MPVRRLVLLGLFIALSLVGANIKLMGSIALDAFPAFLATLLLGAGPGMMVAFIGHLMSAFLAGFPLTLPLHLMIATMMMVTMGVYGSIRKRRQPSLGYLLWTDGLALVFNSGVAVLPLIPFLGWPTIAALLPALSLASLVNILLSELVFQWLPASMRYGEGAKL